MRSWLGAIVVSALVISAAAVPWTWPARIFGAPPDAKSGWKSVKRPKKAEHAPDPQVSQFDRNVLSVAGPFVNLTGKLEGHWIRLPSNEIVEAQNAAGKASRVLELNLGPKGDIAPPWIAGSKTTATFHHPTEFISVVNGPLHYAARVAVGRSAEARLQIQV